MGEENRPEYLYKYLSPNRTDILKNCSIRYSQLHDMNDPFDSNPYFHSDHVSLMAQAEVSKGQASYLFNKGFSSGTDAYREQHAELALHEELTGISSATRDWEMNRGQAIHNDYMRKRIGHGLGALCLTSNGINQLMWSHYANEHQGFAIKFKPGKRGLPFRGKRKSPIGYLSEVVYDVERPIITKDNFALEDMVLRKSTWWEYENEWRIVRKLHKAKTKRKIKGKEDSIYLFDLPVDCIESIVVGCRASKELTGELISILLKNDKMNHISIEGCIMNGYDYQLEVISLFHSVDTWREIRVIHGDDSIDRLLLERLDLLVPKSDDDKKNQL